jgi:N-acetylglucosamine-6-phosphate deacetylase
MRWTLQGAQLVDASFELPAGDLTIDGARIQAVGAPAGTPGTVIDATGMIVMPGFIDVHTHGGGGYNLHTVSAEEIQAYARWAPATGVTSFLIGVVGVPTALPEAQLQAAAAAIDTWKGGAEPLGLHLEGPYISVKRRGAHMTSWLRLPDAGELERVLALAGGHLRLMTLAPELPGAAAMIRRLLEAGITVSMGHTDATYEQAQDAILLGVTHATHCCNAMRPLHHRDPGPLAAIAQAPQVFGELIADGVHVHPAMMAILVKILGPARTIVITDALSAAGLAEDTRFDFAGQPAQLIHGAARLADGTITGSVLTMDRALRNVVQMTGVSLQEAVGMLTQNPAQAARVASRKGRVQAGYDADLVILDSTLALQATICQGRVAFATDAWRERLSEPLAAADGSVLAVETEKTRQQSE